MWSFLKLCLVFCVVLLAPFVNGSLMSELYRSTCKSFYGSRGLVVDCKGRNLTRVPRGLPTELAILDLSQNNISSIASAAFKNFTHLIHLYLQNNKIKHLHKDAFLNLTRLKFLDLTENVLEEWPELSNSLPALESLYLSNNKISSIQQRCLARLPNVQCLYLDYNNFTTVPQAENWQALTKLRYLNLDYNNIRRVHRNAFKPLNLLLQLKLCSNKMVSIEEDAFAGMPHLVHLNLRRNSLTSIPTSAIRSLTQLQQLELDGNPIKTIKDYAFKGLKNLLEISLTWEKLENVGHNAFTFLPLLRRLPLVNVKLKRFPNLTGTHSLQILVLESNDLKSLPENFCAMFPKLYDFNANMNKIRRLPDMSGCSSMELLKLVHNRITSIGTSLQGMQRLQDLTLKLNLITEINDDAFKGLKKLETLNLAMNRIEDISENAFAHMERLRVLDLSNNLFQSLPSKGMQHVKLLYLGGNRYLKEISVEDFPRLQTVQASYPYHCCQLRKRVMRREDPRITVNGEADVDWRWEEDHDYLRMERPILGNASMGDDDDISGFGSGSIDPALKTDTETSGAMTENVTYSESRDNGTENWKYKLKCTPLPDPFFPCDDLMGSWLLRVGVWIVFLLALLGNATVIIVILVSTTKIDVSRFLIMNLAVADLCMGLYLGLLAVVDASTIGDFLYYGVEWQLSSGCKTAGFLAVLSSEGSVFTLTVITIERFIAIRHALNIHKKMSLRKTAIVMVCGWCVAFIIATLPLANVSDYTKVSVCLPFETGDIKSVAFVTFIMVINCSAFVVILGCYVGIYLQIRGSNAWNTNDTQVALRMSLLVVTDLICWAPIAFFSLTAAFGSTFISLNDAKVFTVFCFPLNSCANPFLYAIFTAQFKKDCLMICRRVKNSPAPPKIQITLSKKRYSLSGAVLESRHGSQGSANVIRESNSDGKVVLRVPTLSFNRRHSLPAAFRLSGHLKPHPELSRSISNENSRTTSPGNSTEQTTLTQDKKKFIEMETAL